MILECDIGNTRCKWRRVTSDGWRVDGGVCDYRRTGFADLSCLSEVLRVRCSCVAGESVEKQFEQWCRRSWGVTPEFASASFQCAGVLNGYTEPHRLGVDRWLGIVAAYQRIGGAVVVVQAGTALTVDAVADNGSHLGGYIAPGAALMLESLMAGTGGVRAPGLAMDSLAPGCDTSTAVGHGIAAAQAGAVELALRQTRGQLSEGFAILLTGGGAAVLQALLPVSSEIVAELVLDGLRHVVP